MRLPAVDLTPLFEPKVRRVLELNGADFLRELRQLLVEDWLRNSRVEPFIREMVSVRKRRREEYQHRLKEVSRSELKVVKEAMLYIHPELGDGGEWSEWIREWRDRDNYTAGRFDDLLGKDKLTAQEYDPAVRDYDDPYDRELSVEGYLVAILGEWVHALRNQDSDWGKKRGGESAKLEEWFESAKSRYLWAVRNHVDWRLVSPEVALYDLYALLEGLNGDLEIDRIELDPEDVDDVQHEAQGVTYLYQLLYQPKMLNGRQHETALWEVEANKERLRRAWEGLHVRFASSLAAETIVGRYKTRAQLYDRERLRRVAGEAVGGRGPEDALTRDLCRYLHDEGIFALYKAKLDDIEPDILSTGPIPILAEAKVYRGSAGTRQDIRNGVAQCVTYLNELSSQATGAIYEAHYVVFRVAGPLYSLPSVVRFNELRVLPYLVDLAPTEERGRRQARSGVKPITEEEVLKRIRGGDKE